MQQETAEDFKTFLKWLSPDMEDAAFHYQFLQKKLRRYFERKGCLDPQEFSAETLARARMIVVNRNEMWNFDKINALCFSVASKVWKEFLRKPRLEALPEEHSLAAERSEADKKEAEAICLDLALAQIPKHERDLIVRYYEAQNVKDRKHLTQEYGGENSLRVKAFRIRVKLRQLISQMMGDLEKDKA